MSSQTATQTNPPTRGNARGRNGRGNRGSGRGRGGRKGVTKSQTLPPLGVDTAAPTTIKEQTESSVEPKDTQARTATEDGEVCWICAEPVKYYSVSDCDHRTCHVCALRLRALYKKLDCTFCKAPQPTVIFTISPDAEFLSFTPDSIPYKDSKLGIFFETETMMEDTLILLRFNCPDPSCDYTGSGWNDLKLHVRGTHGRMICDLCIRFKKVFSHEHALYPPNILPLHLPSMPHRFQKAVPVSQIEGGVHPLCQFCRECFFSDDELYTHMRERHEECFVCKRMEIRDQYFKDYDSLERHFSHAHHPCTQPQCQAQKFVVFGSALDLKAHMVEVHGGDMTSRDKKDARRVQADFEFDEVGIGGNRRGRRDRGGSGDHEREPPPSTPPVGPSRPNGRRREGFGANLTPVGGVNTPTLPSLSRRGSPSPPPEDPVLAERLAAFTDRLRSLTSHPTTAVPAVKAGLRGFRASESSARDLISTIWTVLDQNLDNTASVVNTIVDLLEDEEKKMDLLSSWNGFKIEQRRQFPDLVPTSVGSGYAGITGGRVLNAKHSTASRSSQQSSRQLLDRVAQAAGSSSGTSMRAPIPAPKPPERFPALPAALPAVVPTFRQAQRNTPWSASASSGVRAPVSVPGPGANESQKKGPTPLSKALFPELPASSSARPKATVGGNQSLKNILRDTTPTISAWSSGASGSVVNAPEEEAEERASVAESGSGKSKKKGKQKQTLFTLGSFPA